MAAKKKPVQRHLRGSQSRSVEQQAALFAIASETVSVVICDFSGTKVSLHQRRFTLSETGENLSPMYAEVIIHSITANALILICVVGTLGLMIGAIKVGGIGLGSAGVLFAGLAVGAAGFHADAVVLDFAREFGLMLFVFTMGLQLGPGFFASIKRAGSRLNALAVLVVVIGTLMVWAGASLANLSPGVAAGLLAGATTNTPSLGAARQALEAVGVSEVTLSQSALAYSAAYPAGIAGIIIAILLLKSLLRVNVRDEAAKLEAAHQSGAEKLERLNVLVENTQLDGLKLRDLPGRRETGVIISRLRKAGVEEVVTATEDSEVSLGDQLLMVGRKDALASFQRVIGSRVDSDLMHAPGAVSFRRVVVTAKNVLGRPVSELALDHLYGVMITRIVRAGVEMTAVPGVRLQFGDFLHVVGERNGLEQAAKALGDSLKALNTTHFIPVFVGLVFGVLLGLVPLLIPGLASPLKLGLAGGPLIVAILLSRLGKLGPLVWHMPANTNLAFRELGMLLFLASVGLGAGPKFANTLMSLDGVLWVAIALVVSTVPLLVAGLIGIKWLKLNFIEVCGLLSGSMTDPPALAFANDLAGSEAASVAYATVYPLAMLTRIVMAQVLVLLSCA